MQNATSGQNSKAIKVVVSVAQQVMMMFSQDNLFKARQEASYYVC